MKVVFLILIPLVLSCRTVTDLFRAQHRRYWLYARRGLSGRLTRAFLQEYAANLKAYVRSIEPDTPMGKVCIGPEREKEFAAAYNDSRIDALIERMRRLDRTMFYLPPDQVPDRALLPLSDLQQEMVDEMWEAAEQQLEKKASKANVVKMALIPQGKFLFYDPRREEVCKGFDQLVGKEERVHAVTVLYEVLAMVLQMHISGVRGRAVLDVLRHYVAFAFNGIRCRRLNGASLPMTRAYLPFYRMMAKRLLKDREPPGIPLGVVKNAVGKAIEVLVQYRGWGRLLVFRFDGVEVKMEDMVDRLFADDVIGKLKTGIRAVQVTSNDTRERSKRGPILENLSDRQICLSGEFVHDGKCCPQLCKTAHVLGSSGFTTAACCSASRSDVRSGAETGLLRQMTVVYVEEYGLQPEKAMLVML